VKPSPGNSPVEFIRRNYVLGIVNGALFNCMSQMVSPSTVLSVFALRLTGSTAQVGLLSGLMSIGWLWPQFLMANLLDPVPKKKRFYVMAAMGRVISFSALVPIVLLLAESNPSLCFWLIAATFLVHSSVGGMGMIPFMEIVGKSVPEWKRGSFFGWRNFLGAALGLLAGVYVKRVLAEDSGLAFPDNYLRLFQVALVILAAAVAAFCFVKEPVTPVQKRRIGLGLQLRRGFRILRRSPDFRRFVGVRICMTIAGMSAPFYATYAVQRLGAPESILGVVIVVGVCTGALANLFWARVSDQQGNRRVLVVSSVLGLATPLAALVTPLLSARTVHLPWLGSVPLNLACYLFTFVLAALATGGDGMGLMNYLLEIAPARRRPSYMGVSYTLTAPFMLMPWVGGVLARVASYPAVFAASAGFAVVVLLLAVRLREPRRGLARKDI
jgi:MFS family permease